MRRIALFIVGLLLVCPLAAQPKDKPMKFSPEDFRRNLEMFMIRKAQLSPKEADKFFPIFHEMKEKQMKVGEKIMELKRNSKSEARNDESWAKTAIEIESLKVKQAQIGLDYIKRLCKTISGEKVFKAMRAEDAFHRQMLNNFRKKNNKDMCCFSE